MLGSTVQVRKGKREVFSRENAVTFMSWVFNFSLRHLLRQVLQIRSWNFKNLRVCVHTESYPLH